MKYENIKEGKFISRPNRFIAIIEIDGREEVCHVKNTGRCKELLVPGCRVFVQEFENTNRKTKFDLIAVYKGDILINMDSQAPNKVFAEWIRKGNFFKNVTFLKAEKKFHESRFDFYIEADGKKIFAEIKGVTLEENKIALFPDAPTERGVKHIKELCRSIEEGYEAYIFFVIQFKGTEYFKPNKKTHPEFADALEVAYEKGVHIVVVDCDCGEDFLVVSDFVRSELK